ncbi:MAG: hypothetical protein WCP60_09505 [bacterium]
MRSCHEWVVRDDDGVKREIRVIKEAGLWRFQTKRDDVEIWTYYDNKKTKPPAADLESFLQVLDRKYRRRRASHSDIELAKQMLASLPR